jgi:hypothetical protein
MVLCFIWSTFVVPYSSIDVSFDLGVDVLLRGREDISSILFYCYILTSFADPQQQHPRLEGLALAVLSLFLATQTLLAGIILCTPMAL